MTEEELHEKVAEASKTIFSFCMARTASREEAEDLSQDILYELLRSADSLREDNAFYAFMWGVAGNVYKQWCRKRARERVCAFPEDMPADEEMPEGDSDEISLLRRELGLLSEKYRKATILYYIEGLSCAEIAAALGISESMVKYLLFRSRKKLKEGMTMERNLGEHSYNPKTLIPMYSGQGPNQFWDFMQSKIRQNIVSACYNDALTAQQISLEIGIPLPYLEEDISALESKKLLVRDGTHYKTNVIVITAACAEETERALTGYHEEIADRIASFLARNMDTYKAIGFIGSDFSENTLRWQLCAVLFRIIGGIDCGRSRVLPKTGWGEMAYLWCVEKLSGEHLFSYCGVDSRHGDSLYFFDYLKDGKGDHHDFYGNDRYIGIFCDICRGRDTFFGEYDLEAVAEMIKKGYVIRENGVYRATVPIYTPEQYQRAIALSKEFVTAELARVTADMDKTAARILSAHTPKHLQEQVAGIASMDRFVHAVCIPASRLIDRGVLNTAWHPLEMPTTFVVSGK